MPRTNPKPLRIGTIGIDHSFQVVQDFIKKGHEVEDIDTPYESIGDEDLRSFDVITGSTCYRTDPKLRLGDDVTDEESLRRQWEMMEKGVRAIKYPKEKKDE